MRVLSELSSRKMRESVDAVCRLCAGRRFVVAPPLSAKRWASSAPPASKLKATKCEAYVSTSTDPFFNLAYEDWLFRHTDPRIVILYMYRNRESVIIGRNQNHWKEVNMSALQRLGIPFVRRRSGGGTVYHDLGNTNYSVLLPRDAFTRRANAELVSRALRKLDIAAYVNDRHDICVDGFKISGSAYKLVSKRAYHHGTMLIDAGLERLGDALRNDRANLVTKGVTSVRSPVRNLSSFSSAISHQAFLDAVVSEFGRTYGAAGLEGAEELERVGPKVVDEGEMQRVKKVREGYDELKSWDWMYGQTPEFMHDLEHSFSWGKVALSIKSRHALITEAEFTSFPPSTERYLSEIRKTLVGDRYASLEAVEKRLQRPEGEGGAEGEEGRRVWTDLLEWLRRSM